ncbi:MAG TPA: hypothetical protein VKG84_05390 [Candidatus Acidoferrales bacterium]|nr:hypothetical protein [Candidatus Acidoferrales bacterium]
MSRTMVLALVAAALALPVWAQFGPRMPQMNGVWHPVVGAGATYEISEHDGAKKEIEVAVVGEEKVDGQDGYWLEFSFENPRGGPGAMKSLTVMAGPNPGTKRAIFQMNGQAFEMPMNNPRMAAQQGKGPMTDVSKSGGQLVGTESITTPAGTFECQHYRTNDPPSDVWVSSKVSPWGVVKTQGKDSSMLLTRLITDAKTKITGPVKPFDPAAMMQQRP